MKYHYKPGAVRWFRWPGKGDVRGHRAQQGWEVMAEVRDTHPVTGKQLPEAQWWVREVYHGVD